MPAAARVLTAAVADWLAGPPPPAVCSPPFPSSFPSLSGIGAGVWPGRLGAPYSGRTWTPNHR